MNGPVITNPAEYSVTNDYVPLVGASTRNAKKAPGSNPGGAAWYYNIFGLGETPSLRYYKARRVGSQPD